MKYAWNIFGHEKILEYLESQLAGNNLGHAILFAGPVHIGKFTIAKVLSQILQCEWGLCRKCPTCLQIEKGSHLDTIEMTDDGSSLKIEQIREIINRLSMTSQSKARIVLLENIGRLIKEAANALLKILEEPGQNTHFFFTATSLREVPPTILSRMHIIKITPPVTNGVFHNFLLARYQDLTKERYEKINLLSLGKPGKMVRFLESPEALSETEYLYERAQHFCTAFSLSARFKLIQELKDDNSKISEFLVLMTACLRQLLLKGSSEEERKKAFHVLPQVISSLNFLRKNVNGRLLLENLAFSF